MKKLIFLLVMIIFNSLYTTKMNLMEQKSLVTITKITANVTATMYNPVASQCDGTPTITAGMYKINPKKASKHKWIAVSRNLLKRWGGKFKYGDKVIIRGAGHKNGVYKIVDTMNPRFRNRIDFLETKGTKHYKYTNVLIRKLI